MEKTKTRKRPPREVWEAHRAESLRVAAELTWLVERSLEVIEAGFQGREVPPVAPSGDHPEVRRHVADARRDAESQMLEERAEGDHAAPGAFIEAELRCLLTSLGTLARSRVEVSQALGRVADSIRRGRPPRRDLNALVSVPGFRWGKPMQPAGKPGRPKAAKISDPALIGHLGQARKGGDSRSERAILEDLARRLLAEQGKHAVGRVLPNLTANLQKRIANIRAGGIPKLVGQIAEFPPDESEQ